MAPNIPMKRPHPDAAEGRRIRLAAIIAATTVTKDDTQTMESGGTELHVPESSSKRPDAQGLPQETASHRESPIVSEFATRQKRLSDLAAAQAHRKVARRLALQIGSSSDDKWDEIERAESEHSSERSPSPVYFGPPLTKEQHRVFDLVEEGQSIFFTGNAGTGKSYLLEAIVRHLRMKYEHVTCAVAITAPTGAAAMAIGGVTLHSWAGTGLAHGSGEKLAGEILKRDWLKKRWEELRVLLIDEVSMLDAVSLDKLAKIACIVRENC
ncbi:PIF1-like helicase-domain-containing protein [Mycena sp. CBHHK59/15]|nr:PIF1-like helicase-domain-containing protein [Mycena sp. CBHHK59/15]